MTLLKHTEDRLKELIAALPVQLYPDDIQPTPVMRDWTTHLPLRHQGVLIAAIRGCDGAPKDDPSKCLTSQFRRAVMNPADHRETAATRGFFGFSKERMISELPQFLKAFDQYPIHYVLHLMHASEIVAFKHPNHTFRDFFSFVYDRMARAMHLYPETEEQLDIRLTEDRVAAGTVGGQF